MRFNTPCESNFIDVDTVMPYRHKLIHRSLLCRHVKHSPAFVRHPSVTTVKLVGSEFVHFSFPFPLNHTSLHLYIAVVVI